MITEQNGESRFKRFTEEEREELRIQLRKIIIPQLPFPYDREYALQNIDDIVKDEEVRIRSANYSRKHKIVDGLEYSLRTLEDRLIGGESLFFKYHTRPSVFQEFDREWYYGTISDWMERNKDYGR